ncbi:response regulator [Homoserinibacter sp. GY 40078]|uniref:response regulator n=1 Tax=Homoserinibacter sp. GY 40078 TaxID=2603275 RepID=UPI001650B02F|nr:response regulator [Homoserinibacter sp. GY 40078]
MSPHALVVDDDPVTRLVLCHLLARLDWTTDQAGDRLEAVTRIDAVSYDLVISDFRLPTGTGLDVLDAVERVDDPPPFMLVTGVIEHSSVAPEVTERIAAQLTKPVSSEALRTAIARLFPAEP